MNDAENTCGFWYHYNSPPQPIFQLNIVVFEMHNQTLEKWNSSFLFERTYFYIIVLWILLLDLMCATAKTASFQNH